MSKEIDIKIGAQIVATLKELKIKPGTFAGQVGLNPSHFSRLLKGDHQWRLHHINTVSDGLARHGVTLSVDKFLTHQDVAVYEDPREIVKRQSYRFVLYETFQENHALTEKIQVLAAIIKDCSPPNGIKERRKHCKKLKSLLKLDTPK